MKTATYKKLMSEMTLIHEKLGDEYLALCESSGVDPLPVLWSTYPPTPQGETQAYVLYGYNDETDAHGQLGDNVFASSRAELVHKVFLLVYGLRCVN